MKRVFLISLFSVLFTLAFTQNKADAILGTWLTGGKEPAKIEITKSNGLYYGTIIWLKYPEDEKGIRKDINNPNKSLRSRDIVGLKILKNFVFNGSKWIDGIVYDPESGKTYDCNISLKDKNTLEVHGYVGIALFGRTEVWKRL